MRRIRPSLAPDVVAIGDIEMDRAAHRVRRAGKEVHLGPTEYKLLDHLIQHPGRVFSREQLLDAVWGCDVYVEARTVDVHVGRLRKALNVEGVRDPIRTVRSAGYSLDDARPLGSYRASSPAYCGGEAAGAGGVDDQQHLAAIAASTLRRSAGGRKSHRRPCALCTSGPGKPTEG